MIKINITDEQGTLLGQTTIGEDDISPFNTLPAVWIGRKILAELPSDPDALGKLVLGESYQPRTFDPLTKENI